MSRSMQLDVLVRLKDKLSGPLRGIKNQLQSLANFARKMSLLGAAVAAISFMGPIKEAAAFEQKLLDIAGTMDLSGRQAFAFVDLARAKYEALALASGQASDIIATGAARMTAAGLDGKVIDGSIADIARAATAANAEFNDMADVATSLVQTLNVSPDQLTDSLGALVKAGKLGAFEMKDMARYFPSLTSQVAKFGVKGREAVNFLASALQIAKKGTADPAEAANNLKNFLSKILAPATIKNFKDAGVDIQAVMQDAATKGINPIEAVLQKITKLTGVSGKEIAGMMARAKANGLEGADALASVREQLVKIKGAGALGEIFADQQVMDFLIPFLANIDEYKLIKEEVAKATGALIDEDFDTQMAGLNRQLGLFQEIGTQAAREVGFAFGSWLPQINGQLMAGLKWYREWNKASGGMGDRLLAMAGGGVLLATALGALGFVLPVIGAGFAAIGALLSPVGLAIAALAAGAVHLYRNWGTYGPRMMRLWDQAKRGLMALGKAGREIYDRFAPRIAAGMRAAWTDIKAGWTEIRTLFEAVGKGFDLDFSGLTIDNAKIGAIQLLEAAMTRLSAAWSSMKDFGSGFSLHLPAIGEEMKGTIDAFKDIASGLFRLNGAISGLLSLDTGKLGVTFKMLGDLAGKAASWQMTGIRTMAENVAWAVNGLASLVEGLKKAPAAAREAWEGLKTFFSWLTTIEINWTKLLVPKDVLDAWAAIVNAMNAVKGVIDSFANPDVKVEANPLLGPQNTITPIDPKAKLREQLALAGNDNALNAWRDAETARESNRVRLSYGPQLPKGTKEMGAKDGKQEILIKQEPAKPVPVDVSGAITIKVDGPGQVTSTSSTNKDVSIGHTKGGRMIGRP